MSENRLTSTKPDFVFTIIRKPEGWTATQLFRQASFYGRGSSKSLVASYEEHHDHLVHCNRFALHQALDTWAIIQSADAKSPH